MLDQSSRVGEIKNEEDIVTNHQTDSPSSEITGSTDEPQFVPLCFADLIDLYSRPGKFFSGRLNLGATAPLLLTILVIGVAGQIDRLDSEILRHDFDATRATWTMIEPIVNGPWLMFWAFCIGGGIIGGALVYAIGGWWYRMRLYLSDSGKDISIPLARHVYIYAGLVSAIPVLLLTIGFSFVHPNYISWFRSDELLSAFVPIFIFWSVAVSYIGATTTFPMTRWKARLWFLILPCIFYLVIMGLIVGLLALFG